MNKILTIAIILVLSTTAVLGHEWYDQACCSGHDCNPIPCEDIIEKGRFMIYKGLEFSGSMIKNSQDGQCHACISFLNNAYSPPLPRCLYILNGS